MTSRMRMMNQKTINKRDNQRHLSREFQSVLAEHVCDTKHVIAWVNSTVITTNNRHAQRRCLEAWHVNISIIML